MKKTRLTLSGKYKCWTAGLLLVLYSFIAMPVQFWHKHNLKATDSFSVASGKEISKAPQVASASEDCKICSHHYSVYANDHCVLAIDLLPIQTSLAQTAIISLVKADILRSSNKGPPFLIC